MRYKIVPFLALLALLSACNAVNAQPPTNSDVVEATPTPTGAPDLNEDTIQRRDKALDRVAQAPNDPAALRDALDQVIVGLVTAPPGPLRIELTALHDQLVAELQTVLTDPHLPATAALTPTPAPVASAPTPAPVASAPRQPGVAPRPSSQPPPPTGNFVVAERRSFEGSGNAGSYNSCIDIQVLGRNGPLPGAVIGINNGDLNYQNQTDGNGYSGRCGLGPSTWSVVLFWAPSSGEVRNATTTIYLNGADEQRAAVVFREN